MLTSDEIGEQCMKKPTKKNHFVPETYQKGFWDSEKNDERKSIGLLNLKVGAISYSNPSGQMFERKLYWPDSKSESKEIYENLFNKIETPITPILRMLQDGDFNLTEDNLQDIHKYIIMQMLRIPTSLKSLTSASEVTHNKVTDFLENFEGGPLFSDSITSPKDLALFIITDENNVTNIANSMFDGTKWFICSTKEPLITCDRPVMQFENGKLLNSDQPYPAFTDLVIPLTRNSYLLYFRVGSSTNILNLSVDYINKSVIANANERVIFHPDDKEYVEKIKLEMDASPDEWMRHDPEHIAVIEVGTRLINAENDEEIFRKTHTSAVNSIRGNQPIVLKEEIFELLDEHQTTEQIARELIRRKGWKLKNLDKIIDMVNEAISER